MRILHTADWHLGRTLEGRSRIDEQAAFLDELCMIADDENIDAILMAGDVFDTVNPPAAAEQLFYDSITRLANHGKRPVVIISGNHDHPDRLAASAPLARDHGITIVGYPTMNLHKVGIQRTGEWLEVAALPYPSEARLAELLTEQAEEVMIREAYNERIKAIFTTLNQQFTNQAVHVAMSHIFVAGGNSTDSERPIEVGGAYTVTGASLPASAQYVALGHLHRPQQIKSAEMPARYSGSPLAFSFSEAGYAKSVTVIDVKPGGLAETKEVFLTSGKPLVRWRAQAGVAQVYEWLEMQKDVGAWIDLEIHLDHSLSIEDIHKLRKLHSGIIHIRPIFPEMNAVKESNKQSQLPIDELFIRFYEKQTGGAKPEQAVIDLFMDLIVTEDEEEKEVVHSS